jgi:ribosomal protein S10
MADERRLREVLVQLSGTSGKQLDQLVAAIKEAAIEEAFDYVTGESPVPSSMVDARALRLRRLCHHARRPLRQREIEIVFRIGPATARTVNARMHATYPLEIRSLAAEMKKAMQADATTTRYKDDDSVARYKVAFGSIGSREFADTLLAEAGLAKGFERPDLTTITFPMQIERPDGTKFDAAKCVLGVR